MGFLHGPTHEELPAGTAGGRSNMLRVLFLLCPRVLLWLITYAATCVASHWRHTHRSCRHWRSSVLVTGARQHRFALHACAGTCSTGACVRLRWRAVEVRPKPCVLCAVMLTCCIVLCRYAVGTRGWLTFQGRWAWWLKDYIDRAFMNKYGRDLRMDDSSAPDSAPDSTAGSS
jgi:hypothetical protein